MAFKSFWKRMGLYSGSLVEWVLFYLTLLNLLHLRTSDLGLNRKANSNLGTSNRVDSHIMRGMTSFYR